ncbi:hypothetical protein AVEN_48785-1 [Araneus ventricosus]|uniref:Uncharacterized protein n=1 Tax=Araneus ventricosus TaxID=182803 RepID=A0A4Y2LQR9_ARAVE|nr:hypothetical protein AVEN_48785-1 [Araneus ventricosus]
MCFARNVPQRPLQSAAPYVRFMKAISTFEYSSSYYWNSLTLTSSGMLFTQHSVQRPLPHEEAISDSSDSSVCPLHSLQVCSTEHSSTNFVFVLKTLKAEERS